MNAFARPALRPPSLQSLTFHEPRPARALSALPALLLAMVALPYAYYVTLSEPDLVRMVAAMVYGAASGAHEAAGMHYGLSFSFGYYKLLYAIAPERWLHDPDSVALLVNLGGIAAGLACALAATAFLANVFGRSVGVAAAMLFFLSPMMLPVAFSGHPLVGAAACFFAAGLLLAGGKEPGAFAAPGLCRAAALALLVLGLSLRAEIVIAFPFLWLAASPRSRSAGGRVPQLAAKALLLAAAFGIFLALQHACMTDSGRTGNGLGHFVEAFLSVSRVGRGAFVCALAAGVATLLLAAFAALRLRKDVRLYLVLVLALPALLFWLPNPQPARHFFFPVLGACLVVALWLDRHFRSTAAMLALSLTLVAANQLAAEALYAAIVSRYPWSYPSAGRQATQQVPLGAFAPAQRANQAQAALERDEARRLAAHAPRRLLVLADSQHYLIAHLIAADPQLEWSERIENGVLFTRLRSPRHSLVLVEKYGAWPRDVTAEVLADPRWQDWPVYVQPFTVSRYDRTEVPGARLFVLP